MPTSSAILDGLTAIANEWRTLAIAWHLFFAALLLLVVQRRSARLVAFLLIAPFVSVSALAWVSGNPFNGTMFAALSVTLVAIAARVPRRRIEIASPPMLAAGLSFAAFGWFYPHFVEVGHWTEYAVAAPLGLIPCPTLTAAIGVTLMVRRLHSTAWSVALTAAGLFYGVFGVFGLGVMLDVVLIAGAGALAFATAAEAARRTVRATPDERGRVLPGSRS